MIKSFADIDKNDLRGLVRRMDGLGRVSVPKEYRSELGLENQAPVEFHALSDGIFIRAWEGECDSYRRIDNLGRLAIPVDLRRALDIAFYDELEIFLLKDSMFIRKKVTG